MHLLNVFKKQQQATLLDVILKSFGVSRNETCQTATTTLFGSYFQTKRTKYAGVHMNT